MAALQGTLLASGIVPTDSQDTFATHSETYGLGGYRSVQSLVERDSIPDERRTQGMLVFVNAEKALYRLTTGVANTDWENLGNGSGSPKRKIIFLNTDSITIDAVDDYSFIEVWLDDNIYRPALWNQSLFNSITFNQEVSLGAKLYKDYEVFYDIENSSLIVQLLDAKTGVVVFF